MEEDNSPKRLAYEVGMMLSAVASHGPAALTTTSDPMYTAQLLSRLKRALEAVGNIHHEKRGQRPRYAPEDPHAEGEPIGWVTYVICAGCNADWPCATASAMGHRSGEREL